MIDYKFWVHTVCGPWIEGPNSTQYKVTFDKDTLFIVFEGSTSKLDWWQNFSFIQKAYKHSKVKLYAHRGFLKKYKGVREKINEIVLDKNPKKIIISGFSQGAAIAILCHEDMKYLYPNKNVKTYAFGAPKVFWFKNLDKVWERFADLNLYLIKTDLIPTLPPSIFGYKRVGKIEWWKPIVSRFKIYDNHMSYGEVIQRG